MGDDMKARNFKPPRGYSYCEPIGHTYHVTLRAGRVMPLCGRSGWLIGMRKVPFGEIKPDGTICAQCRRRVAHRQAVARYEAALRANKLSPKKLEAALAAAQHMHIDMLTVEAEKYERKIRK